MDEELTSSATSFSSFLKSKDSWTSEWMVMIYAWNTMKVLYLLSFLVLHTCYFVLTNLSIFPIEELLNFSNYGINNIPLVNSKSERE